MKKQPRPYDMYMLTNRAALPTRVPVRARFDPKAHGKPRQPQTVVDFAAGVGAYGRAICSLDPRVRGDISNLSHTVPGSTL